MLSDKYIDKIKKAQFDFSGKNGYIALFTNPFFFVRKHLYDNIKYFAPAMRGRVLDFGCGAKPYQELFKRCTKYIGCDIDVSGHDHTNETIDVIYDGKVLPFGNEEFDSLFSSEVFEHIDNLEEILSELNRVLKKGGYMLITVPFVWNEHEVPYDFRRYTSYGLKNVAKKYGFDIVKYKKSTSYIETVFQLVMVYIHSLSIEKVSNRGIRIIIQRLIICPIAVLGIIFSMILPHNDTLYADNIVLMRKIT